MSLSINLSATHPLTECLAHNAGEYSRITVVREANTQPEAQAIMDERAKLGQLLCLTCGAQLTNPRVALDM
jgi:hypothetical protein